MYLNKANFGIMVGAFFLFFVSILSIFSSFELFIGPDIWGHYGWILDVMKGIPEIPLVTRTFHNFFSVYFQMSGFPLINAWIASVPLLFVTVIAFYMMSKEFLSRFDRRAPVLSTLVWSFFSGFGWVYALYLNTSNSGNWLGTLTETVNQAHLSVGYPPGFWSFMGENPPVAIGFTALFMMLYLSQKKGLSRRSYLLLCTATFAVGYMFHAVEVAFFLLIFLLLPLLNDRNSLKDVLISIGLATSFALSYDIIYQHFLFGSFTLTIYSKLALVIFFASTVLSLANHFLSAKSKLSINYSKFQNLPKRNIYSALALFVIIFVFGLSFLICLNIHSLYTWQLTLPYRFVPWYFYPVLLGTVGISPILTVAFSDYLLKKYKGVLIFLVAFSAVVFFSGRAISFININFFDTQFNETRVFSILFVPLAMLASISFIAIFDRIILASSPQATTKNSLLKRKMLAGIFVVIMLLSGFMSTLLTVDYWTLHSRSSPNAVNSGELEAMEFLNQNTNPVALGRDVAGYDLAFTYTQLSSQVLQAFSGTGYYAPYSYKGNILFNAQRFEEPLYYFYSYRSKFIYMSQNDYSSLNTVKNSFMNQYLSSLPKKFSNDQATIYQIQDVVPPVSNSKAAIVLPAQVSYPLPINYASLMFAEASLNYTEVLDSDPSLYSNQLLILPADPATPKADFVDQTFTDWVSNSANLTAVHYGNRLGLSYSNSGNSTSVVSYERQLPLVNSTISRNITWKVLVQNMSKTDYGGIMLYDNEAKDWFWVGAISLTNPDYNSVQQGLWTEVSFDTQNNQWHNFTSISKMRIVLRVSSSSFENILSDYISFSSPAKSQYNPHLTAQLLQWTVNGGDLIVINSDGLGDFSNFLNLRLLDTNFTASSIKSDSASIAIPTVNVLPISVDNSSIRIVASYKGTADSPFAIQKLLGKGSITYLYVQPCVFALINSANHAEKANRSSSLGSLLKVLNLPITAFEASDFRNDGATFRQVEISGSICINSDSIILPPDEAFSVSINSTNFHDGFYSSDELLDKVITYGNVGWSINCQKVTFMSGGLGLYSVMLIRNTSKLDLIVENNSLAQLSLKPVIEGDSTSYNITRGVIEFTITPQKPIKLLVRSPHVSANGTSVFTSLFLEKKLYDYSGTPATIVGPISFDAAYSDTFTLASNFVVGQEANLRTTEMAIWDEWGSIPWVNISLDIGLLTIIVLLVVPYLLTFRRKNLYSY